MDEQRLFATGTNPTASPENAAKDAAMQAEIDAGLREFGEPRADDSLVLVRAADIIEAAAKVADAEAASMKRVAEFHQPPRVDGDNYIADLHDQGEIVAQRIAASIRAMSIGLHEPKAAPGGWREAIEAAAMVVDGWQKSFGSRDMSHVHEDMARAIRALVSPPPEDKGWFKQCFDAAADAADALMAEDKGRGDIADTPKALAEQLRANVGEITEDGCREVDHRLYDAVLNMLDRADIAAEVPEGDGGEAVAAWMDLYYRSVKCHRNSLDELAASRAEVERVREIIDLWFAPWGAAKAAKWEELTGDRPFDPHVALTVIRAALAAHAGSKGGE